MKIKLENLSIKEESKLLINPNSTQELMVNGNTYINIEKKNKQLLSRFEGMSEKNDLIIYQILNPIYINKNKKMKFSCDKNALNELFLDYKEKRNNNEIYSNELYELLNPCYLVEKNFLKRKHISKEILADFKEEKELLNERQINRDKSQFYDKENKILFKLLNKEDKLNKIKNKELIKDSINDNCLVIRLKNNMDNLFNKILLLKSDYTFDELKLLIKCIYKVKYGKQNIKNIDLFYQDKFMNEFKIDSVPCLGHLAQKLKTKYELNIYIEAQY